MRPVTSCVLMLLLISVAAAGQTERQANDFQSVVHLFDYDAKQPLDIHDKVIEEFSDGTLHEISYSSPKGGPVGAYLVVPKGKGPFAAGALRSLGQWHSRGIHSRSEDLRESGCDLSHS
jgi:hypothetical protein